MIRSRRIASIIRIVYDAIHNSDALDGVDNACLRAYGYLITPDGGHGAVYDARLGSADNAVCIDAESDIVSGYPAVAGVAVVPCLIGYLRLPVAFDVVVNSVDNDYGHPHDGAQVCTNDYAEYVFRSVCELRSLHGPLCGAVAFVASDGRPVPHEAICRLSELCTAACANSPSIAFNANVVPPLRWRSPARSPQTRNLSFALSSARSPSADSIDFLSGTSATPMGTLQGISAPSVRCATPMATLANHVSSTLAPLDVCDACGCTLFDARHSPDPLRPGASSQLSPLNGTIVAVDNALSSPPNGAIIVVDNALSSPLNGTIVAANNALSSPLNGTIIAANNALSSPLNGTIVAANNALPSLPNGAIVAVDNALSSPPNGAIVAVDNALSSPPNGAIIAVDNAL